MYAHNYSLKRLSGYLFQSYANPTLPWTGIGVWLQNDRDDLTQNSVRTNMGGMQGMHGGATTCSRNIIPNQPVSFPLNSILSDPIRHRRSSMFNL